MEDFAQHQFARQRARRPIWLILKIVLALVLVGFVLTRVSLNEMLSAWRQVSLPWIAAASFAFCATAWLMARRYWLLIGRRVPFREVLALVITQTVLGNLVATSAGAASYVALLRSKHQVPVSRSLGSILVARFGDALALLVALGLSSLVLWPQLEKLHAFVVLLGGGLAAVVLIFALMFVLRQSVVAGIGRLVGRLGLDRFGPAERGMRLLSDLVAHESAEQRSAIGKLTGWSGATLLMMLLFAYCQMRAFAAPVGIWHVVLVVALTQLTTLVPIQVFGGLGVIDVTSLYLYGLFGLSQPVVAAAILASRVVFYAMNLLVLLYLPLNAWLGRELREEPFPVLEGEPHSRR